MTPLVPKKKELTIIEVIILNIQFSCIGHGSRGRSQGVGFIMKTIPIKYFVNNDIYKELKDD